MKSKREERYVIRKTHDLDVMIAALMTKRRFSTLADLFRTLIREAWEKYCQD